LTRIQDKSKYIKGIEYERVDFSQDVASQICDILYSKEILSVLIEGGSKTLQTFIEANLWDEARIFTGSTSFETGIKAPLLHSDSSQTQNVGGDTLKIYRND
jgi:diaminohydroxyphosphoribosylaminopyrimidine deaminase/5-amino-6-(5-phosphoribosylamino)uracil reductase